MIKNTLSKFRALFSSVHWFEIKKKKVNYKKKQTVGKLIVIKSYSEIKTRNLKSYFNKFPLKINRFKKNIHFLVLASNDKKKILCSGWLYKGTSWEVTEVNKKVNLKNSILLFDFLTPNKFRNKGYYKKILELIINKNLGKKLAIYSLSNNIKSLKAIKKAGFKLKRKIYGI